MATKKLSAKEKQTNENRVRRLTIKQKKTVKKASIKVPGSFRLFGRAWQHMWRHKKLFGGILAIYALLYIVLVKGLATNFQLSATRDSIEAAVEGGLGNVEMASALFGALIGTAGTTSGDSAGVYQLILFVVVSLSIIWALRQTIGGRTSPKIRQAFYNGPSQVVPYVLVLLVVMLQMIPALIGVTLYSIVTGNGIAVGFFEQAVWLILLLAFVSASFFFISSSLFATYIVALPGMTPLQALRSARQLVRHQRWLVMRKVLFLPVMISIIMLLIFMPLVLFAPVIAEVLFLIFILLLLLFSHSYLYILYRELMP